MASISNISVSFSANTSAFTSGLASMKAQVTTVTSGIATGFFKAQLAIEGLKLAAEGMKAGFAFITAGIADATKEIAAFVEEANKIGISSSKMQAFAEAAKDLGISTETIKGMFGAMAKSIESAADGSKKQQETFTKLGLSVRELQSMAPDKSFEAIKTAIMDLSTEAERNSAGMDVFGKKWIEIGPLVRQSAEDFAKSTSDAAKTGQMLAESDNLAVKAMADNWRWLGEVVGGAFSQIAAAFAPVFNDLVAGFKAWITDGNNFADTLMLIVNIIEAGILAVGWIIDGVTAFVNIGLAGFNLLATGAYQLLEIDIKIFRWIAQSFLDMTINPMVKAWNALPLTNKISEVKFTILDGVIESMGELKEATAKTGLDFYDKSKNALEHGVAEGMMAGFDKFNSSLTSVGRRAGEQVAQDMAGVKTEGRKDGIYFSPDNTTSEQHLANLAKMTDLWAGLSGSAGSAQEAYNASLANINVKIRELAKDHSIATGELVKLEAAWKAAAKQKYEDDLLKHEDDLLKPTQALVDKSQSYINIDPEQKLQSQLGTIEAMKKAQLDWAAARKQTTEQALVNNVALSKSQTELQQRYFETYTTLGKLSKDFSNNFSSGLAKVLTSSGNVFKNIGRMFSGVIRQMIQEWLAFQLKVAIKQGTDALFKIASSIFSLGSMASTGTAVSQGAGGFMGNGSGFVSAASIGVAAEGGDINGPTIVGELGPELFIPKGAGTVIPNNMLGGMNNAPSVNYTIYAYDTDSVERTVQKMRPMFLQDALQGYQNARVRRQG